MAAYILGGLATSLGEEKLMHPGDSVFDSSPEVCRARQGQWSHQGWGRLSGAGIHLSKPPSWLAREWQFNFQQSTAKGGK